MIARGQAKGQLAVVALALGLASCNRQEMQKARRREAALEALRREYCQELATEPDEVAEAPRLVAALERRIARLEALGKGPPPSYLYEHRTLKEPEDVAECVEIAALYEAIDESRAARMTGYGWHEGAAAWGDKWHVSRPALVLPFENGYSCRVDDLEPAIAHARDLVAGIEKYVAAHAADHTAEVARCEKEGLLAPRTAAADPGKKAP